MKALSIQLILATILFVSCEKEENDTVPVANVSVSDVEMHSADIHVSANAHSTGHSYTWGIALSKSPNAQNDYDHRYAYVEGNTVDYTMYLTYLDESTTYYVRPFCSRNGKRFYPVNEFIFKTASAPEIGGTGPGGGIIFYLNGQGGGLEMSTNEYTGDWGCQQVVNGTNTAIGTGAQNTSYILSTCGSTTGAPYHCDTLTEGGYSDWHLPSYGDLITIYQELVLGGFWTPDSEEYLSSSDASGASYNTYYTYSMISGATYYRPKGMDLKYVAVRSF